MSNRVSKAVRARKARVWNLMAEVASNGGRNYHRPTDFWWRALRDQRVEDPTLEEVSDPMLRRVLQMLVDDGKVEVSGYGRKRWKAITLKEKLAAKKRVNQGEEWDGFLARLAGSPLVYERVHGYRTDGDALADSMAATEDRYGARQSRIVISPQIALALVEMLEDFPGIAAQYFDFDFPDSPDSV